MAGRRSRGSLVLAALIAASSLATPPSTFAGETQILPGSPFAAVTADIDGDGAGEVVRMHQTDEGGLTVDAWSLRDGGWASLGEAIVAPPNPGLAGSQLGTLLTWRAAGRERVLVVSGAADPAALFQQACCVSFAELAVTDFGIALVPVPGGPVTAQVVRAADVDADGTDELILTQVAYEDEQDPGTAHLTVLRLEAGGFEQIYARDEGEAIIEVWAGDTDGIAGSEVLVQSLGPTIRRLVWDGQRMVEKGRLDLAPDGSTYVVGIAGGRILTAGSGVRVLRWPRGEPSVEVARVLPRLPDSAIRLVGAGADAVLVVGGHPLAAPSDASVVYDLDLNRLGEVRASTSAVSVWELLNDPFTSEIFSADRIVFPWDGPLPFELDGRPAFVMSGALLQPGGAAGFEVRDVGNFVGLQPLGLAGPGDSFMVLGEGLISIPGAAILNSGADAPKKLVIIPLDDALRPDDEAAQPAVELRGAVETDNGVSLLAGPAGFRVVIAAPPGTRVMVGPNDEERTVGDEPMEIEILPLDRIPSASNQDFGRALLMLTPDGRGSVVRLEGTFIIEPPTLEATSRTEAFSLRSRIAGRTADGVTVTVDGARAETDRSGAFELAVDAPIWPRDVVVVARDAVGNETTARLQIVGFLDYRGLPWLPILGLATLGGGIFLFVRTPRRRTAASGAWGDGALEEMDADADPV